jgi:hypothetical protein
MISSEDDAKSLLRAWANNGATINCHFLSGNTNASANAVIHDYSERQIVLMNDAAQFVCEIPFDDVRQWEFITPSDATPEQQRVLEDTGYRHGLIASLNSGARISLFELED